MNTAAHMRLEPNMERSAPNSLVWIVLDSCRYDTFVGAAKPNIDAFCAANQTSVQRRYSYASWTSPSHFVFLMGIVPHTNPSRVFASDVYRREFRCWEERLGIPNLDYMKFVPSLSLPKVLKGLGYRTIARVSMPVLNEATGFPMHFDDYRLMDDHADFEGIIEQVAFRRGEPTFCFLNLGETHYPYMLSSDDLPRISGVHGVFRSLNAGAPSSETFFDEAMLSRLRLQQRRCVEYVDSLFPRLLTKCPSGTHIILTSDHGELFGEDGFFGHGPIIHDKVFEVPFVEGKVEKYSYRSRGGACWPAAPESN